MLPDGGALTPALRELGYTPYSLQSSFQKGNASTHPVAWSLLFDRKTAYDKNLFTKFDAFVGPPAAMVYNVILRDCPEYTKVVLVEEVDKEKWANEYDAYMGPLLRATKRTQRNKVSQAFTNMLKQMVVSGVPTSESTAKMERYSYNKKSNLSSSTDLHKAFATAEKGGRASARGEVAKEGAEVEAKEQSDGELKNPRAIALERFEESVKMLVPPSRLLVYRYGEGWEPLCQFLEKAVPDEPFPPYDDGLHVLGNLQERIERAQFLMRVCMVLVSCLVISKLWPYKDTAQYLLADFVQDVRVAFGKDDDAVYTQKRMNEKKLSSGEQFDDTWEKKGGKVTVIKS
ncbi:hypothetical protein STCU_00749 [Strigomonas culicis]|nr:hypothetical protein STCU_00749 [Strigomonas culicis]|eukprot:EPY36112.1 hypothetical protein STCU_00749 [Strigomonas culicis]